MTTSVSSEPAAPPTLGAGQVAFALALLLGLQPVTTDLYLPALPLLTRDLGTTVGAAQQTMSALLLSFGLAQLVWGPVSDRVGRRPVLIAGLVLYTLAAAGAVLAGSITQLVAWRTVQGAGMAAAIVGARALLRDCFEPQRGARVMAWGMSGLGLLAIASPSLGGVLAAHAGWRAALAAVALAGAVALAFVALRLPETAPRLRADATHPARLLGTWRRIATHPVFVAWATLSAATYGGLFILLAASPFIYIGVLGMSPSAYGVALASASLAYIAGTFVCRHWVARHGPVGAVKRGALLTLAGGAVIALPVTLGLASVPVVLLGQCLFAAGHGVHQPCGQAGVTGPFPDQAGAAAALAGFVLAAVAFALGVGLGLAMDGTVRPLAYGVAACALATSAIAWTLVQRLPAR